MHAIYTRFSLCRKKREERVLHPWPDLKVFMDITVTGLEKGHNYNIDFHVYGMLCSGIPWS